MAITLDPANTGANGTLSNGNMTVTHIAGSADCSSVATVFKASGKWYYEAVITATNPDGVGPGICNASHLTSAFVGADINSIGFYNDLGNVYRNNAVLTTIEASATGHTIGVAWDMTAGTIWWKDITTASNWNNNGTASPGGTGGITYSITGSLAPAVDVTTLGDAVTVNFGQKPFAGTIPSGFAAYDPLVVPANCYDYQPSAIEVVGY